MIVVLESEQAWSDLLCEILSEIETPDVVRVRPAGKLLSEVARADVIVADWSLLYGGPVMTQTLSLAANDFLEDLESLGFDGTLVIVSGLESVLELKELMAEKVPSADVFAFLKLKTDWNAFQRIVSGAVSSRRSLLRETARGIVSYAGDSLVADWRALIAGADDPDGKLLEGASVGLFESEGFQVLQNVLTDSFQHDMVLKANSADEAIWSPRWIVVECKNLSGKIRSHHATHLTARMDALGAQIGIFIGCHGLTSGHEEDHAARRVIDDYSVANSNKRVIIYLSFELCLNTLTSDQSLRSLIEVKCDDQRLRRRGR